MSLKELKIYFNEWAKEVVDNPYYNKSTKDYLLNHKKRVSYKWCKKALKNGITLKEIKKIEYYLDFFYSETYDGHVLRTFNGFTGVGILEFSADHKTKEVNPIMIFGCGHNKECNDIEEQIHIELTLEEAEDLAKGINICVEKYKNRK